MISENRNNELNKIWKNTVRYNTATSKITTLSDLYNGLEKSGYFQDPYQKQEHLHLCTEFVIFEKEKLKEVLETLEIHKKFNFKNRQFSSRLNGIEYKDKKLGVHPSSILNAEDLYTNPMLLTLLIGELHQNDYFDGNIIYDENNREIILRNFNKNTIYTEDDIETFIKNYKIESDLQNNSKKDLNASEANEISQKIAHYITLLSSLEKRNKMNYIEDTAIFEKELELGGNLKLSLKDNKLYVDKTPIYEISQIPKALIDLRIHQNTLKNYHGTDENVKIGINIGIEKQKKKIIANEGIHYPMFKIIIPSR